LDGKSGFFKIVLLFIITLLILVVAVLAFLLISKGPSVPSNTKTEAVVIKDDDLGNFPLYESDTPFNLKNSDPKNTSYVPTVTVAVELSYFIKPENSSVSDPKVKLEFYKEKIKSLIVAYIMEIPRDQAPEMLLTAPEELKILINKMLTGNEEKKGDIVYEVTFSKWFIV